MKNKTNRMLFAMMTLFVFFSILVVCNITEYVPGLFSYAAADNKCGDNLLWSYDSETKTLTISGTGNMYDYYCEEKDFGTGLVTTAPWNQYYKKMKNIIFEPGITYIGNNAFYGFTALNNVTLPDTVINLGSGVFYGCTAIKSIVLPDSVINPGSSTFFGCSSLESIDLGAGIQTIGNSMFLDCTSLSEIEIPDSVKSIGSQAFINCTGLKSISIPDSVTEIGLSSFQRCEYLETVDLGDNIRTIGDGAFCNCYSLSKISIPASVDYIGVIAFEGCTSLETVELPDICDFVGYHAFNLTPFSRKSSNWYNNGFYVAGNLNAVASSSDETFVVKEGTVRIDEMALDGGRKYKSIVLPASVRNIDYPQFYSDYSVENFSVSAENPVFHSAGNCIIETESGKLILGCKNSVIPDDGSVKVIADKAFYNCESLTSITIPNSVTDINDEAFSWCSGLENLTLGNGITNIGLGAFRDCPFTEVYYNGTEEQWNNIYIDDTDIQPFDEAIIHYHSEHVFDDGNPVKEPTCTEEGQTVYVCSVCDYSYIAVEPAKGHTEVTISGAPATCTDSGVTDGIYCSVCKKVLKSAEEIAPLGHDEIPHEAKPSTCIEHGYKAYVTCSRCDYTTYEELPLGDHSPADSVIEESTDSTCNKAGEYDEVVYCSVCGDEISRIHKYRELGAHVPLGPVKESEVYATCTKGGYYYNVVRCGICGTELSREKVLTNPTGHSYSSVVIVPTCTGEGYTTFTCICGDAYTDNYVPSLGHSFTDYVYNNDATTKSDGTETGKCSRCDATDTRFVPGTKLSCSKTDTSTGVSVEFEDGTFGTENDNDLDLIVERINEDDNRFAAYKAISGGTQVGLYEIHIHNSNNEMVQPVNGNKATVRIPIPAAITTEMFPKLFIHHRMANGNTERIKYVNGDLTIENGFFVFRISSFSEFAVVIEEDTRINPTANAVINVAGATSIDYRTKVTIKATASNLGPTYHLVIVVNGKEINGDNKEVTYEYGELKNDVAYFVKIVDEDGKVQKDISGNELVKEGGKIKCNAGFVQKLIAFFRVLFGSLPEIRVEPKYNI
ncbi:MAG: leucine-rich repeat domain-containing protein [Clostridia bacterium]|nr:leucine-rich repeat domain-containing protein [Clostridia bacterium]